LHAQQLNAQFFDLLLRGYRIMTLANDKSSVTGTPHAT
jgi:hypothetical protein